MGAHLRLRLGVSLVVAVSAAIAATALAPLPAAILLIAAASTAGALLGWPGAVFGLALLVFADGVAAKVAVGLAGALPWVAMHAWRRWSARDRRRRAEAAAAERARLQAEMHASLAETLELAAIREPRADPTDAALPDLVAAITHEWSQRSGVGVILHSAGLDETGAAAPEAGIELCWILREALANVAAHARAETVAVTLERDGDGITLEIRDDGAGFTPPAATGRGIAGMRERARVCGGQLTVWSRPGGGTRITATVPAAMAVGAALPSWRVRLGAAMAAAVVPLAVVALLTAPGGLTSPLAADDGQLPFDPNATRGPATAQAGRGGSPGRSGATGSPAATPSRGSSGRPSGAAGTSGPAAPPPTTGPTVVEQRTCRVAYVKRSEWSPGFVADVTLTNLTGAPMQGWSLRFDYTAGQKVTSYWNAIAAQSGTGVVVRPTGDQPTLAAGGSLTFGVQGVWQGTNPSPSAFTLNGSPCG
ncbi:cellulose binding domain-containing protein [Dactylosporangium sp. NPDC000244]|uniref:cellulose binding domain-containing protein n=1 Tax=Dactylosporangium sp. NPDC000244 TaxID=3154365 RepID=UPI00331C90B3